MQLSKKEKTFFRIFFAFLKSILTFERSQKTMNLIADGLLKMPTPKERG